MNPDVSSIDLVTDGTESEIETVDAVPVLVGGGGDLAVRPVVVSAAAVAATTFVVGATAIVWARGLGTRRRRRSGRSLGRRGPRVVSSQSLLLDIHVLDSGRHR